MSLPQIKNLSVDLDEEGLGVNRKISMLKHVKKKAANDAQLLMNRIALIQKEEERARKKIQETKERAAEIISLRNENERRVQAYVNAAGEVRQLQQVLIAKNREQDTEGKKARQQRLEMLHNRRREEVSEMVMEKKYLTQLMLQEQSRDIHLKQQKREQVKKMEEEMRLKKEQERREKEKKMKEMYQKKLEEEALEAKRAEKLVKLLEKKEKEWINKLKAAQTIQDTAFEQLENALTTAVPSARGAMNSRMSQGSDTLTGGLEGMTSSSTAGFGAIGGEGLGGSGGGGPASSGKKIRSKSQPKIRTRPPPHQLQRNMSNNEFSPS